jgi:hypothetical protein
MEYDFKDTDGKRVYLRGHRNLPPEFTTEPLVGDFVYSDERDPQWSGKLRCYRIISREHHFEPAKYGKHNLELVIQLVEETE